MRAWIKTQTVDRYLQPLRQQMLSELPGDISMLELGCGTGDFLFHSVSKLSYGLGIDANSRLIQYAERRKQREGHFQLDFKAEYLTPNFDPGQRFDWGVAFLFFHVLPPHLSLAILKRLKSCCNTLLIAAFSKPSSRKEEWLMWLDQRWTGHYQHYRAYADQGYMEELLRRAKIEIRRQETTFDPCVVMYVV